MKILATSELAAMQREQDTLVADYADRINKAWQQVKAAGALIRKTRKTIGPELELVEIPLAKWLVRKGYAIAQQQRCRGGRVDIVDHTNKNIIECKFRGNERNLFDAGVQLKNYHPEFPGHALVIAVHEVEPPAEWLCRALEGVGFRVIETQDL